MIEFHPKKVEEMLGAGKTAEAKSYIEGFIKKDMTEQEKAAIHFDFMMTYVKVMNVIKEQRNAGLRSLLDDLNLINKSEKAAGEKLKLAKVRAELSEKK